MMWRYRFDVFTTPCELQLTHKNKELCDGVANAVYQNAKRLEAKYSYYDSKSLLYHINHRENSKEILLDDESSSLLNSVQKLMHQTDYVFDIARAGTLKVCYYAQTVELFYNAYEMIMPYANAQCFELSGRSLRFSNLYTMLDLGGVVKEYAVDMSADIVRKHKISSALINFGGDMSLIGTKEDGKKWRIGIKNPQSTIEDLFVLEISDSAIVTSGHYERSCSIEGNRFSHIIDTRITANPLVQATTIGHNAMKAGIFSTSLLINPTMPLPKRTSAYLIDYENRITHEKNGTRARMTP